MSEDQALHNLSSKLQDTVDRIDKLQQKPSFRARLSRHIRTQSSSIIHAMLAGCIFTVALGRMAQKNEFEEQKQLWSTEKAKLEIQNQSLQRRVSEAEVEGQRLRELVERELRGGGWRLGPVANRIHKGLAETLPGEPSPKSASAVAARQQPGARNSSLDVGTATQPAAAGKQDTSKPRMMI